MLIRHAGVARADQEMKKLISLLLFLLGFNVSDITFAQKAEKTCEYCWIDSATGKPVPTIPLGTPLHLQGVVGQANQTGRTHIPSTGQNVVRISHSPIKN
jgi:hypothetical protein